MNAQSKQARKGNDGIKSTGTEKIGQPKIQKPATLKNLSATTKLSSIHQLNSFLTSSEISETKPMTKNSVQIHSKLTHDKDKVDSRPLPHEKSNKSLSKESKECCEPDAVEKAKSSTIAEANTIVLMMMASMIFSTFRALDASPPLSTSGKSGALNDLARRAIMKSLI